MTPIPRDAEERCPAVRASCFHAAQARWTCGAGLLQDRRSSLALELTLCCSVCFFRVLKRRAGTFSPERRFRNRCIGIQFLIEHPLLVRLLLMRTANKVVIDARE